MNISFGSHFTLPDKKADYADVKKRFKTNQLNSPFRANDDGYKKVYGMTALVDTKDPEIREYLEKHGIFYIETSTRDYYISQFKQMGYPDADAPARADQFINKFKSKV